MKKLKKFHTKVLVIAEKMKWLPGLLTRLTLGVMFVEAGWGKLGHIAKVTQFFLELGIPMPEFHAWLVALTELVCGALLIVGVFVRYASVALAITMGVALVTAKSESIETITDIAGVPEFLYIILLSWLAVFGAGSISLYRALGNPWAKK
ncbi:MAG: DoxX family protein [Oligoflexia bacterium]|nr:DoxX family protein [Oligoflexia bacterium]